jgi:hypothetical protein
MFRVVSGFSPKHSSRSRSNIMRYGQKSAFERFSPRFAPSQRVSAAAILRALVLVLVVLLLLFVALMQLTGRYEVGLPVLGGILSISLAASHYMR